MNKKQIVFLFLCIFIFCLAGLTGCMSAKTRPPLDEFNAIGSTDPNAVNLWPLYLRSGTMQSFLFPFIKTDKDNFILRPVYSYDNGVHSILPPIFAMDFERREYRLPPFIYFPEKEVFILLPVFYYNGSSSGNTFVGIASPLVNTWWHPDGDVTGNFLLAYRTRYGSHGLFPIWWHNEKRDLLIPLWYKTKDDFFSIPYVSYQAHNGNRVRMITPLAGWKTAPQGETQSSWVIPLYYYDSSANVFHSIFYNRMANLRWLTPLPIIGQNRHPAETTTWAAPFFYHSRRDSGNTFATPFGGYSRENGRIVRHGILPLYYSNTETGTFFSLPYNRVGGTRWITPFPIAGQHIGTETTTSWAAPLFYHKRSPHGSTLLTPLGGYARRSGSPMMRHGIFPFYYSDAEDDTFYSLLYNRSGMTRWLSPLPIVGQNRTDTETQTWAFPFFLRETTPNSNMLLTPLGGYGKTNGELTRHGVFPFYYRQHRPNILLTPLYGHVDDLRWVSPLPIINWQKTPEYGKFQVVPLFNHSAEHRANGTEVRNTTLGLNLLARINSQWNESAASESFSFHLPLLLTRVKTRHDVTAGGGVTDYSKVKVLQHLLFSREVTERTSPFGTARTRTAKTAFLLGLYMNKENDTRSHSRGVYGLLWNWETRGTVKNHSILGYLYRHTAEADGSTSTLAFPFIQSASSPDGSSSSSFLWRVWREEKDAAGKTRKWFFFIPI